MNKHGLCPSFVCGTGEEQSSSGFPNDRRVSEPIRAC